jgi:hypothetical protein
VKYKEFSEGGGNSKKKDCGRVYNFEAYSAVDREAWIDVISKAIPLCVFGVPLPVALLRDGGQVPIPIRMCCDWLNHVSRRSSSCSRSGS